MTEVVNTAAEALPTAPEQWLTAILTLAWAIRNLVKFWKARKEKEDALAALDSETMSHADREAHLRRQLEAMRARLADKNGL